MESSLSEAKPRGAEAADVGPAGRRTPDLSAYAETIVHVGVSLQPGQTLTIRSPLDGAPLVRAIAAAAYAAGAPLVDVEWRDPVLDAVRLEHADRDTLSRAPTWRGDAIEAAAARGDAFVGISGLDPDLLAPYDATDVATLQAAKRAALRGYRAYTMSNRVRWVVAAAATPAWAVRVFPELDREDAVAALWDAIRSMARSDAPDPVAAWKAHLDTLAARRDHLQVKRFRALHFVSDAGTDLTVGLADRHRWEGGDSATPDGISFVANLPTEEIFTAPHKDRVDGVVVSSKPLSYAGKLIDGFRLEFRDGEVVDARAERGQDTLRKLLDSDAGSRRLGEVALVPHSSPIAQSGLLFYNTLFDENAASHLALGRGYPFTVQDGANEDRAALDAAGLNDSDEHVDFMIGDASMNVFGVHEDGREEPVMKGGEFVF